MELFNRRYLCFICFAFIFISVIAFHFSSPLKILFLILLILASVSLIICFLLSKTKRFLILVGALSTLMATVALFNSLIYISIPAEKAAQYNGTYTAELEIISLEYSDSLSTEYNVRLLQMGKDKVNVKSYLVCDFESDFSYGDRLVAVVDSENLDVKSSKLDKDILLYLHVDSSQPIMYAEESEPNLLSFAWVRSKTKIMRRSLCEYIDGVFDGDGALVKGMLINERSDIQAFTKSQFRRAGASHLLAVSGLHVSLLLGALEIFLRRVFVPKKIRIFVILTAGIFLLALTDFSASALRATFMLFAVYLNYMLAEENDSVTSLFASVALITLLSPYSVADIGLWLSFGATLGLVSVYPYLRSRVSALFKKAKGNRKLLKVAEAICQSLLITAIANVFVLPLMWYFFGEMSISSLLCNLLLSPLTALYLPACVLALIFGRVAWLGKAVVFIAKSLGDMILATVGLFADLRWALVSLEYPFASVLVIAFTVSMAILMIIKLKRKMLICLPAAAFVLSFCVCLLVFTLSAKTQLRYVGRDNDEIILSERAGKVSVCDMTQASSSSYKLISESLCPYSVEIENYIITDISDHHPDMLERIYDQIVIRNIYIPISQSENLKQLYEVAQKYNTTVNFYQSGEAVELFDDLSVNAYYSDNTENESLFLCFYDEDMIITYSNAALSDGACSLGAKSKYFLIGNTRATPNATKMANYDFQNTILVFADKDTAEAFGVGESYVPRRNGRQREFLIVPE